MWLTKIARRVLGAIREAMIINLTLNQQRLWVPPKDSKVAVRGFSHAEFHVRSTVAANGSQNWNVLLLHPPPPPALLAVALLLLLLLSLQLLLTAAAAAAADHDTTTTTTTTTTITTTTTTTTTTTIVNAVNLESILLEFWSNPLPYFLTFFSPQKVKLTCAKWLALHPGYLNRWFCTDTHLEYCRFPHGVFVYMPRVGRT